MSGNICPFMSSDDNHSSCIISCKFYSEKSRECIIKKSLETLTTQYDCLEDIKDKLIAIQDKINDLD
ncbi:MAG: hypothetical protein PHD60_08290 [Clostridia bacterium]|nr:hypothetical protein [Clostridia bacterium]